MNFEKKMKDRGNLKIESMIETPDFIKIEKQPKTKKKFPLWAKIAIPTSLGLVFSTAFIVVLGGALIMSLGLFFLPKNASGAPANDKNSETKSGEEGYVPSEGEQEPGSSDSAPIFLTIGGLSYETLSEGQSKYVKEFVDIDLNKSMNKLIGDEVTGLSNETKQQLKELGNYSLYHIDGSSSSYVYLISNSVETRFLAATDLHSLYDGNIEELLNFFGINDDYQIRVYDYQNQNGTYSYSNNIYNFSTEDSEAIVNNLKTINSDYSSFSTEYDGAAKSKGLLKGISHKLVFSDGVDLLPSIYYSQLKTINMTLETKTSYDIEGNEAFTIMDEKIEMDYDPNYVIL